jgi:hypothetical protein
MEERNQPPLETLKDIKNIMERSSRFISLSGLSGIAAGICGLAGARFARRMLDSHNGGFETPRDISGYLFTPLSLQLIGLALVTFIAAFLSAFLLTWRKAKKEGIPIWDHTSKRLFWNMILPIVAGGLFILGMAQYGEWRFITAACLLFYGLALVNASKYTLIEVRYLGYCEVLLGLINMLFIEYGLIFWAAGFGVLHIIYGTIMWWKYERK